MPPVARAAAELRWTVSHEVSFIQSLTLFTTIFPTSAQLLAAVTLRDRMEPIAFFHRKTVEE